MKAQSQPIKIKRSMKRSFLILATVLMIVMAGCKKENPVTPNATDTTASGARTYVLNEGLWGANNASLSLITQNEIANDWFAQNNGRGLGDLGQDMIHYGSTLYVVVHSSSTIECVDPATGVSRKQISLGNRKPRYAVGYQGKLYISCYDKTIVRIDTTSLEPDGSCQLSGMQPEQLCALGGNLYVCNTWQYGEGNNAIYDSTISIVSLDNFAEVGKITVGLNPSRIKAIDDHRLLVTCGGNYDNRPARTLVVDVVDGSQTELSIAATNFDICDGVIYMYCTTYDASWNSTVSFYKARIDSLAPARILEEYSTLVANAYGINVDPATKKLYVCNSAYGVNSDILIFSPEGALLSKFEAGTFANKVVF